MNYGRIAGAVLAAALFTTAAHAEPRWRVLAQFDDAPEGMVADGQGGLFPRCSTQRV